MNKENDPKGIKKLFGQNLRAWRVRQGKSLKQVSSELGVAESTWSQWENGIQLPTANFLDSLSQYLEMPLCHLFGTCDRLHDS